MNRRAALLLVLAVLPGCGSSGSGGPQTGPSTAVNAVNMAGEWRGTLEASGAASRAIALTVSQGGACVDGIWRTEPAEWTGAISGYADASSFSGSISLASADGSGRCTGAATVSGPVDGTSIRWTTTAFTGTCPSGLPRAVTITLRRP